MSHKIVFLYSELSGYFLSCANALMSKGVEVHIVRWPVNKEAPFKLEFQKDIHIYEKEDYKDDKLMELINNISPNLIVASGWMDKDYLRVCRSYKGKIPTVMSMDNHWKGTLKQYIATLMSPFFIHNTYSHIWIPGEPQYKYAKKLRFKDDQILKGFYSADINRFIPFGKEKLKQAIPKRFLYVGRYVQQKGLDTLFNAFMQIQKEKPNAWELWCVGTGPLQQTAPKHPKIKHLGFKQPSELTELIAQTGIFVLPSRYEPWGVVVHEMAASAMPMLVSNKVGAATQFIKEDENGFIFEADNILELKEKMLDCISKTDEQLQKMAIVSEALGSSYSPPMWADTIMKIL